MKRIFVPTQSGADWQVLLAKRELHWKPGKSAMSAAACWEEAGTALPPEVARCLDSSSDDRLQALELLLAVPEWEVALPGGKTASHTDVLAVARNELGLVVIAVEAKVDEPFGPTLGEKRLGASDEQRKRLDFLHSVLGLAEPLTDSIRYQLLHRTASAILTARQFHANTAVMLVQSFSPDARWRDDFLEFASAMGCKPEGERPMPVPDHDRPSLYLAWCAGDQQYREADLREAE
jgi:hypothetical protein